MPESAKSYGTRKGTGLSGTPTQRGYDSKWYALSRSYRAEHPVCEMCRNALSEDCDHIVPFLSISDPKRLDPKNLRALCRSCHNKKTWSE